LSALALALALALVRQDSQPVLPVQIQQASD